MSWPGACSDRAKMEIGQNPGNVSSDVPVREPSGILAVRTRFLRRRVPGRKLPRPSSGLLLVLFLILLVGGIGAAIHRRILEAEFESRVARSKATPFEIKRIRRELADLELDEKALARALDTRLKLLENAKKNEFYVAIDTKKRQFSFHFANKKLREAPVEIGAPRTIVSGRKTWTFAALTGSFSVEGKYKDGAWHAPEWVFRMNGRKPPQTLPTVKNGLGKYVINLGNDYVIHSPPPPDSPLKGAKPGSFLVPEADLAAIWPRIGPETRVYVF